MHQGAIVVSSQAGLAKKFSVRIRQLLSQRYKYPAARWWVVDYAS